MARIVIAVEYVAGYDEQYNEWASNCIQQYIGSRPTPYNIVYVFGNDKQDCVWHKVDSSAAVTIATEEFITRWSSDAVKMREQCSHDLHNIIDNTPGDNSLVDVVWFMDDLYGFQLDDHVFEALNKMLSWQPTTRFHIIVRRQFSSATPTFVKLLGATVHHGDDCIARITSNIPVWRGSLLLNSNNQDNIALGGLQLECQENHVKSINSDLVMEAIQVIQHVPSHWACPVEYKLSANSKPAATLLQALDNQYLIVRFTGAAAAQVDDDQCCMMIGSSCCHGDTVSCKAWLLRRPDVFMPLPTTPILHQMISHDRLETPPTAKQMISDVLYCSLKQYYRQLLLGCHELDCEQSDWPEMRLLKDKEFSMNNDSTTSTVVPTCDDSIFEDTSQVLSKFKHDGSCDHTSELSPVTLGCIDDVQYRMCSEGEHKLTRMEFDEACNGCYHGISYCVDSAESHDSKLVGIQQKCVSKETQCSHDCKGKLSPQEECSHGNQQQSHNESVKRPQAIDDKKKRSLRHKKRLQVIVMGALKERGVSRKHRCFTSCYKRLFNLSKSFLKDLQSSKNLTNEMRRVTSSNAQQVIEFECRRLGITAPSQ